MTIGRRVSSATATLLALATGIVLATAGPAAASTPTDRLTLHAYGRSTSVTLHVFTQDGHDHTWGEIYWGDGINGCVWEDQTTDPTQRTWNGLLRETCNDGAWLAYGLQTAGSYTTPLWDGPGYWVRACGTDYDGAVVCTAWN